MDTPQWRLAPAATLIPGLPIEPGLSERLLGALSDAPEPFAVRLMRPLPPIPAGERVIPADQTNHSVIVGETVVVKWFARPSDDSPAPELFAHLAVVGFGRIAEPYAAVFCGEALLALVTAYLPEATDGWEWCVDEAVSGGTAFAGELGRIAAELHVAMATPSPVWPEPVRMAAGSWFGRAGEALAEALRVTEDAEDSAWLAAHEGDLRRELAPLAVAGETPVLRIHGDLHVGQVLRWRDGFAVVDFDGNPTVTEALPYQPAARDLAQLATSLEHVAQVAVKRREADPQAMVAWAWMTREALETAYVATLAEAGRSELLDRSLVRPFEVEQECRELIYAARHLPRWRYAPMGVLRSWF
ncbi:hypothetical protein Acor_21230 [Acrocarpospora corrugata]|uniref:Glucosamine kinase n=1 Tax=Acrocarpospora corrugata TaxID=35763 RepID=A0A5M3VVT6_9ACTN|nr:aminoglycoside phosphotransferase [Acrocarpospora corrugata]GES00060.1 hypothetical protein Acor_21230 [Acrocarpospora corrugata]